MRKFALILLFLVAICVFSCENMPIINCSDCLQTEPANADITLNLDVNAISAEITVYEGDIEDNIIFSSFNHSGSETTVNVTLNKKYTFTALYRYQNTRSTYTAVDSALPRVKYDESQCDNPCYFIYDNKVNLRIKYH